MFIIEQSKLNAGLIENRHSQDNEIGAEGAKNMAEALKTNNTLTSLNLGVRFFI